ncbi:sulfatase [Halogeometricum luteum]|uniref:Sulfatase-like hydrolase/transferase n=1 Tax=Halogeometricum luteum TaxID=2950537 RepID=A0ABU2G4Y7_9EURY|nr:sulfatase [Halogeometricum sp. S3BR5-2]MDS0295348.1 sulfatase-like hydrolase/transferase [Halogeometricum sp. S3BR5-2]
MHQPNVLLIVLDTARMDTVTSMLNAGDLPGLKKFADNGCTFTNAYANAPWTLPSHAAMFTGQRSSVHGAHAGHKQFNPETPTLAELLYNEGYDTLGISGNSWVSSEFGFGRGFSNLSMKWDRYWKGHDLSSVSRQSGVGKFKELVRAVSTREAPFSIANAVNAKILGADDFGTKLTTDRTVKWLRKRSSADPFFYFINYLEPHLPYEPPGEFVSQFVTRSDFESINQNPWEYIAGTAEMSKQDFETLMQLYKAEIAYLDKHLSRLYDALVDSRLIDETAVFIVGDHGENIGDHGLMDHQYSLHSTLLNVPLIAHYPPEVDSGKSEKFVELRDLYRTVANLAGISRPISDTVSNFDILEGDGRDAVFAEYRHPQPDMESLKKEVSELVPDYEKFDNSLRSVRTAEWKLIESESGDLLLYDSDDESVEISSDHPKVVSELSDLMDQEGIRLDRTAKEETEMSAASKQRLADLGYI